MKKILTQFFGLEVIYESQGMGGLNIQYIETRKNTIFFSSLFSGICTKYVNLSAVGYYFQNSVEALENFELDNPVSLLFHFI